MTDIVDELRNDQPGERQYHWEARAILGGIHDRAADEITRLRAENEHRYARRKKELRDFWADIKTHGSIYASIRRAFGERCKDVHPNCGTCRAWEEYDEAEKLEAENERLREELNQERSKHPARIGAASLIVRAALKGNSDE